MVAEVRDALQRLWDALPEGAGDIIFPRLAGQWKLPNLRTQLHRLFRRAGLTPPPKPWNNLRASSITDWADVLPSHAVNAFAGHSEAVSRAHYRQVTAEHVARLIGATQNPTQGSSEQGCKDAKSIPAIGGFPVGKVTNADCQYSREDSNL